MRAILRKASFPWGTVSLLVAYRTFRAARVACQWSRSVLAVVLVRNIRCEMWLIECRVETARAFSILAAKRKCMWIRETRIDIGTNRSIQQIHCTDNPQSVRIPRSGLSRTQTPPIVPSCIGDEEPKSCGELEFGVPVVIDLQSVEPVCASAQKPGYSSHDSIALPIRLSTAGARIEFGFLWVRMVVS